MEQLKSLLTEMNKDMPKENTSLMKETLFQSYPLKLMSTMNSNSQLIQSRNGLRTIKIPAQ
jgi:hypothetical protein